MSRLFVTIRVTFLTFLTFSLLVNSQTTDATISGTVNDPSGASVVGARLSARNLATGVVIQTEANKAGVYVFPALQPGTYQVTAEHTGFQKYVVSNLELEVAARLTLNFVLELGATSQSIEVQAMAAQEVGYLTSSIGTVVNGRKVLELPLA